LRYDDSLDVFGVHGIGGLLGTLLAGVFATAALSVTPEAAGTAGLLEGNPRQLWVQVIGAGVTIAWSGITTLILLKLVGLFVPLRVSDEEERAGLDLRQHGEQIHT
jgi:ammonium transporter, Amt family